MIKILVTDQEPISSVTCSRSSTSQGNRAPNTAGGIAPGRGGVVNDHLFFRGHLSLGRLSEEVVGY